MLGEEGAAGGTARYVDSSLERLQVKVRGLTGDRHVVACNGRRVPLPPTGTRGEFVAGVRFRAWQPPSCLHPTIARARAAGVRRLIDTWTGRSIGGCTYHVVASRRAALRDASRQRATRPRAAGSRASRRSATRRADGSASPPGINPDFPLTLDLRRAG